MIPTQLNIEVTTRCTAGCYICPRKVIDRKNKDMALGDIIDIVDQGYKMGIRWFGPHLLGEPTMHPEYVDIITSVKNKYPKIKIKEYTNGYGFSDDKIIQVMLDMNRVFISVDGAKHETMKSLRPGLDPVEIEEGIKRFCELKKEKGSFNPRINMRMTVLDCNKNEIQEYQLKWKPYVDHVICVPLSKYMGDDLEEEVQVRENLPCDRIFFHVVVNVNKDVVLCCEDVIPNCVLGNLDEKSLEEIWFGEKMEEIRRLHIQNRADEIPICKVCTHKVYWK